MTSHRLIQDIASIRFHIQLGVHPILIASFALFYLTMRQKMHSPGTDNVKTRQLMMGISRQMVFLLLLHFSLLNPYVSWLPHDIKIILYTIVDILLIIPPLRYFLGKKD